MQLKTFTSPLIGAAGFAVGNIASNMVVAKMTPGQGPPEAKTAWIAAAATFALGTFLRKKSGAMSALGAGMQISGMAPVIAVATSKLLPR